MISEREPDVTAAEAMPANVPLGQDGVGQALDTRLTESKFSLAMDAVTRHKSHAGDSVTAYFDALLDVLDHLPVERARDGALDVGIVGTIDASKDCVNQLRNLLVVIAEADNTDDYTPGLASFLEGVLRIRKQFPLSDDAAYLWRDALAFICREIFLSVIAALVASSKWQAVGKLLDHDYASPDTSESLGFNAFDGFQRSLDVFRHRRLRLRQSSVTSDILQKRVRESALSFEQIMQADFVLHLIAVIRRKPPLQRWYARTLDAATEQQLAGFEVFVNARAGKEARGLMALFGVASWTQLRAMLGDLTEGASGNTLTALDYAGFIAANNAGFNH